MNEIKAVLDKAVAALSAVPGVQAVVLGGSRARGTHSPDSDIDVGIYYDNIVLDLAALNIAAQRIDDEHRENLIAPPGEWGKWVNGGGWLIINGYHVDFILRDVERVKTTIHECQEGIVSAHYQTGHPHAYMNAMYMGELAIIQFFTFEADFSCMFATSNASKDDRYYVMAHLVRSVSGLNQVLFALNGEYCLNEKKAVKMIESFPIKPADYQNKVDSIFTGRNLPVVCDNLRQLINEVKSLMPRF